MASSPYFWQLLVQLRQFYSNLYSLIEQSIGSICCSDTYYCDTATGPPSNYYLEIGLISDLCRLSQSLQVFLENQKAHFFVQRVIAESPTCEALVHSLQLQLKAHIQFVLGMRGWPWIGALGFQTMPAHRIVHLQRVRTVGVRER